MEFADGAGTLVGEFFEDFGEIGGAGKAAFPGDFIDGVVALPQQFHGVSKTAAADIIENGGVKFTMKVFTESDTIAADLGGDLGDGDTLPAIGLDKSLGFANQGDG